MTEWNGDRMEVGGTCGCCYTAMVILRESGDFWDSFLEDAGNQPSSVVSANHGSQT